MFGQWCWWSEAHLCIRIRGRRWVGAVPLGAWPASAKVDMWRWERQKGTELSGVKLVHILRPE